MAIYKDDLLSERIHSSKTTAMTNKKVSPSTDRGRGVSTVSDENNIGFKTPIRELGGGKRGVSGNLNVMRKSMFSSSKNVPKMQDSSSP